MRQETPNHTQPYKLGLLLRCKTPIRNMGVYTMQNKRTSGQDGLEVKALHYTRNSRVSRVTDLQSHPAIIRCVSSSWFICFPEIEFLPSRNGARLDLCFPLALQVNDVSYALVHLQLQQGIIQLFTFTKESHCLCDHRRKKNLRFTLCLQFTQRTGSKQRKGRGLRLWKGVAELMVSLIVRSMSTILTIPYLLKCFLQGKLEAKREVIRNCFSDSNGLSVLDQAILRDHLEKKDKIYFKNLL